MLCTIKIPTAPANGWISILTIALLMLGNLPVDAGPRPRPRPRPQQAPNLPPQNPAATTQPNRPVRPAPPASAQRGEKMPEPQEISGAQLETRDHVSLSATFYPGTKQKESVPVLLLHSWKSSRKEFAVLAPELQKKGCAVLAPDLRGHGGSTTKIVIGRGKPREEELDANKFRPNDFTEMAKYDMAALRTFLVKKNNAGELNMNKLVIVGSGRGAAIAMIWSAYDWTVPNYEHAGIKQGQDVKALVLISPERSYPGLDTTSILNARGISPVRDRLSIMLLVGNGDSERLRDVERLEKQFVLKRPAQPEAMAERTVLFIPFDSKLQADKLLMFPRFPIPSIICRFVEDRVINGETDAVWMEHR